MIPQIQIILFCFTKNLKGRKILSFQEFATVPTVVKVQNIYIFENKVREHYLSQSKIKYDCVYIYISKI